MMTRRVVLTHSFVIITLFHILFTLCFSLANVELFVYVCNINISNTFNQFKQSIRVSVKCWTQLNLPPKGFFKITKNPNEHQNST